MTFGVNDNTEAGDRVPASIEAIASVLSPEGWAYASSTPVTDDDPGRFHALFGRDSLIFALQVLPVRPDIARSTLRALAALQGRTDDPEIDEQPGKILHEYRPVAPDWLLERGWPTRSGAILYYGTSDATSWFLTLLDACRDPDLEQELATARQAAGQWLLRSLHDGRGFVRCGPRLAPGGLAQQGWRDTLDPATDSHHGGIVRPDGSTPSSPLADADSQAAAVAALRALTRLDPTHAQIWRNELSALRARVSSTFGPEVLAVDAADEPVAGAGSQLGWLLWADALDEQAAAAAMRRLTAGDVLTPYGLRTLSMQAPAFVADGYHRGAVWPFDNWLGWGGLRAAGDAVGAEQVRVGVRRALAELGRYPELYAVDPGGALARVDIANRVQAWTIGAAVAFDEGWDGRTW